MSLISHWYKHNRLFLDPTISESFVPTSWDQWLHLSSPMLNSVSMTGALGIEHVQKKLVEHDTKPYYYHCTTSKSYWEAKRKCIAGMGLQLSRKQIFFVCKQWLRDIYKSCKRSDNSVGVCKEIKCCCGILKHLTRWMLLSTCSRALAMLAFLLASPGDSCFFWPRKGGGTFTLMKVPSRLSLMQLEYAALQRSIDDHGFLANLHHDQIN